MRRILCCAIAGLVLMSCGGGSAPMGADDPPVASSVQVTATTAPPEICSNEVLSDDVGLPMVLVSDCVDGWAVAAEKEYLDNCMECESALLVTREAGKWQVAFNCYGYQPLGRDMCSSPSREAFPAGAVASSSQLPGLKTACAIWPMNTFAEFLVSAGCFGDVEDLRYSEIPNCPKPYTEVTGAPLYICSKGSVVRDIQQALADLGYKVTPDGFFGVGTLRAYIKWQKDNMLLVTGVVDDVDLCRLGVPQC